MMYPKYCGYCPLHLKCYDPMTYHGFKCPFSEKGTPLHMGGGRISTSAPCKAHECSMKKCDWPIVKLGETYCERHISKSCFN